MVLSKEGKVTRSLSAQLFLRLDKGKPDFLKVVDALKEQFGPSSIQGIQVFGIGKLLIHFSNEACLNRAVTRRFLFNQMDYDIQPLDPPFKYVTIKAAPFELERSDFEKVFSTFGIMLDLSFVYPPNLSPWHNGDRIMKFEMLKPIPNFIKIGSYLVEIVYQGVDRQCRRCFATNHLARTCKVNSCRICKEEGHFAFNCPQEKTVLDESPRNGTTPDNRTTETNETTRDMEESANEKVTSRKENIIMDVNPAGEKKEEYSTVHEKEVDQQVNDSLLRSSPVKLATNNDREEDGITEAVNDKFKTPPKKIARSSSRTRKKENGRRIPEELLTKNTRINEEASVNSREEILEVTREVERRAESDEDHTEEEGREGFLTEGSIESEEKEAIIEPERKSRRKKKRNNKKKRVFLRTDLRETSTGEIEKDNELEMSQSVNEMIRDNEGLTGKFWAGNTCDLDTIKLVPEVENNDRIDIEDRISTPTSTDLKENGSLSLEGYTSAHSTNRLENPVTENDFDGFVVAMTIEEFKFTWSSMIKELCTDLHIECLEIDLLLDEVVDKLKEGLDSVQIEEAFRDGVRSRNSVNFNHSYTRLGNMLNKNIDRRSTKFFYKIRDRDLWSRKVTKKAWF